LKLEFFVIVAPYIHHLRKTPQSTNRHTHTVGVDTSFASLPPQQTNKQHHATLKHSKWWIITTKTHNGIITAEAEANNQKEIFNQTTTV
jgi:hypothetical protein